MTRKIIVYTCITKGYDKLIPVSDEDNIQFICFTDKPGKNFKGWTLLPLQSPNRFKNGHDINRYHKFFPQHLFPDNRYSIYLDGNVQYLGSYQKLVEQLVSNGCAFGAFRHREARSTDSEADACKNGDKFDAYDLKHISMQLTTYKEQGFDMSGEISANYFLVREHSHPTIAPAMSLWWSQIFEYSKRDQISLNFVLWKEKVPFIFLDDLLDVDAKNLLVHEHKNSLVREKIPHFIKRNFRQFQLRLSKLLKE